MANKTITQLTAVASVASVDEFEVQVSGEVGTKKCTLTQLTQVESTARTGQDDIIENSVGLATDGTYPLATMENSWYLRLADHVGIIDRSGLVEDLSSDIINALRMLDYQIYIANKVKTIEITLTSAEILALNTSPKVLLTVAATDLAEVLSVYAFNDYNSTTYEAGTNTLLVRYASTETLFEVPNAFVEATADAYARGIFTANQVLKKGQNIEAYCASNPTTGNGTWTIGITYLLH